MAEIGDPRIPRTNGKRTETRQRGNTQRPRPLAACLPFGKLAMKQAIHLLLVARLAHVALSISKPSSDPTPDAGIRSAGPCRVAVCISGDVRSFVDPTVHRSFQRHVVEAIEGDGCDVDLFAYASLGHEELLEEQDAAMMQEAQAVLDFLSPVEVVWHQKQAGIIPNPCRQQHQPPGKEHPNGRPQGESKPLYRERSITREKRFYWQLYESLAAYRMAVKRESENEDLSSETETLHPSTYDWIVGTRFDVAWARPLPSLRAFSSDVVWFDTKSWPMSDNFALVPRAHSDLFFSAIEAYYVCNDHDDGASWPPGEAWWQPDCGRDRDPRNGLGNDGQHVRDTSGARNAASAWSGSAGKVDESSWRNDEDERSEESRLGADGFVGSILYRHLHAKGVPHRSYSMFEYYPVQPSGGGDHGGGGGGGEGGGRAKGIGCETGTANYATACLLLGTAGLLREGYLSGDCSAALSEWSALHCRALMHPGATDMDTTQRVEALLNPAPRAWQEGLGGKFPAEAESRSGEKRKDEGSYTAAKRRVAEEDLQRARSKLIVLRDAIHLGDGGGGGGDRTKARGDVNVVEEGMPVEAAQGDLERNGHRDDEGWAGSSTGATTHVWSIHSQNGCRLEEHSGRAPHVIRQYTADSSLAREVALATTCLAHSLVGEASAGSRGSGDLEFDAETACGASRPLELVMIDVSLRSEELGVCTSDGAAGLTTAEYVQHFFADPAANCVGYGRMTLPPPPSCPELLVRELEVFHPRIGAVYWEGPVQVDLTVSLTGPGLQDLDLDSVHVCADTEVSWPIQDWTRCCVSLEELASSAEGKPPLVFGSTIGVVEGSVSIRDARPGCVPPGEIRGRVLRMEGDRAAGDDGGGEHRGNDGAYREALASKSVRFKVVHHESLFRRRGRPVGPAPLGRGFATTQEYIQALEEEAEEEASTAFAVMDSHARQTHATSVEIGRRSCSSRLDLHDRATSLAASRAQLGFHIEQLNWMLSRGKLPEEMKSIIDRLEYVRALFPHTSTEDSVSRSHMLRDSWRTVGSFFQKALVMPIPAGENGSSVRPLQTWEYDEIPWMEALNPTIDWTAVEEAYLGNRPVKITHVDSFFSKKALDTLLDLARGSSIFVDNRVNYLGSYPSDGMSHPLLYQIAEEAAERLPRILGRNTPGWPLVQTWFYIYGGNDGERCTRGIRVHADTAMVNLNVWLAPDTANLGSAETDDGGGLTIFHAKPPDEWGFDKFNRDDGDTHAFLRDSDAGNTSVPHRQNRALLFDSMLFHQSDPFRFKQGFENRRLNLTLLFGRRRIQDERAGATGGNDSSGVPHSDRYPPQMREVTPREAGELPYCL